MGWYIIPDAFLNIIATTDADANACTFHTRASDQQCSSVCECIYSCNRCPCGDGMYHNQILSLIILIMVAVMFVSLHNHIYDNFCESVIQVSI